MGIFDYVNWHIACPVCGTLITEFQTKDGDVYMHTVEPFTVSNFYGSCPKCAAWLEYNRKPATSIEEYTLAVTKSEEER